MTRLHLPRARPATHSRRALTLVDLRAARRASRPCRRRRCTAMDAAPGSRRAGAAVSEPPRLCADAVLHQLRLDRPVPQCDARLTVHLRAHVLRCHHCGAEQKCPLAVRAAAMRCSPLGHGTERVEETLARSVSRRAVERLDRDNLRAQAAMQTVPSTRVHSGEARILVGTQMLTKGHHFPDVTLVVILNADQSLFSTRFPRHRATGADHRAGGGPRRARRPRPARCMIQTQFPDHPLLRTCWNRATPASRPARWTSARAGTGRRSRGSRCCAPRHATPQAAMRFLEPRPVPRRHCDGARAASSVRCRRRWRAGPDRHHAQLLIESGSARSAATVPVRTGCRRSRRCRGRAARCAGRSMWIRWK